MRGNYYPNIVEIFGGNVCHFPNFNYSYRQFFDDLGVDTANQKLKEKKPKRE